MNARRAAWLLVAAAPAATAGSLPAPPTDPGIRLAVSTPFTPPTEAAALPIELSIRNDTARTLRWRASFRSGWLGYAESELLVDLEVAPGATRIERIVVPVAETRGWSQVHLRVEGTGVDPAPVQIMATHDGREAAQRPGVRAALSAGLARDQAEALQTAVRAANQWHGVSTFIPAELPARHDAYAGLRVLALTSDEWQVLAAEARQGVLDWVGLGGRLLVAGAPCPTEPIGVGFHECIALAPDGLPDRDALSAALRDACGPAHAGNALPSYTGSPDVAALGEPHAAGWGFALALLATALLLGPVNLLWLAGGRRRHRLFWTTPALAALASAVLLAAILARDGTGGDGRRVTVLALMGDAPRAAILQEQAVRSGLLLESGFRSPQDVRITHLSATEEFSGRFALHQVGDWREGLFASRRLQAQLLETVRPTRGGVRVLLASREALSSFEHPLEALYVVDREGRVWEAAGPAAAGRRVALQPATNFSRWWTERLAALGPVLRERLEPTSRARGFFFARSRTAEAIPTLDSIRWTQSEYLLLGPAEFAP